MTARAFEFTGPAGYALSGKLETPDGPARGWAIFAHCFSCGKDSLAAGRVAQALAKHGVGTLRFDFAGLGKSGGKFAESFAADTGDLIAAGKAMADAGMTPTLLVGHSLGGAAVLSAAGRMPEIKAVATIAAPADVAHVLTQFDEGSLAAIKAEGEAEVLLAKRPFKIRQSFIDDVRGPHLEAAVAALHRPLMILHSPVDETVGVDNATRIFLAAKHPKSFVSLGEADHLLTRREDADFAAAMIAAWAGRYMPTLEDAAAENRPGVTAEETGAGRFQVEIRAGGHRLLADEPESVGGLNSGLSPYELVAAGLAACTTMTLRLYAERKALPVERIRTAVGHTKTAGAEPPDTFSRVISLEGELTDDQRQRLLEIADRCPVDLTLVRGAKVTTKLGEDAPPCDPREEHCAAMEETTR